MNYRIVWLDEAEEDYLTLIRYLRAEYGLKSAKKFKAKVESITKRLEQHPHSSPKIGEESVRKAFVTKQTSMYYRVLDDENEIEIMFLWNNRRNPDDLPI